MHPLIPLGSIRGAKMHPLSYSLIRLQVNSHGCAVLLDQYTLEYKHTNDRLPTTFSTTVDHKVWTRSLTPDHSLTMSSQYAFV